jgi:hypothetical protein
MAKIKMMYKGKKPFVRILGFGEFYKDKAFEIEESEIERYLRFGDFKVVKDTKKQEIKRGGKCQK